MREGTSDRGAARAPASLPRRVRGMPLYWIIDSRKRLFVGSGDGEVSLADAMSLLEALAGAGALSYRKLFDACRVQSPMTDDELLALSAKIRAYHDKGPVGALAIVATREQTVRFARLLGALAAADRPMRMFVNLRQARNWLDQKDRPLQAGS
jgi:hypothetical protein